MRGHTGMLYISVPLMRGPAYRYAIYLCALNEGDYILVCCIFSKVKVCFLLPEKVTIMFL